MSGHTKWADIQHKASREKVVEARLAQDRAIALHELRVALGFTQKQLAGSLGMTQPGISRLEGQTDLLLSTLRSYVRALGGDLELRARFGDTEVQIDTLADLDPGREIAASVRGAGTPTSR